MRLDSPHVALEISQVGLLVEYGGLESKGMDDVVDLAGSVFKGPILLLGGGVSTCPGSVINPETRW